MPKKDDIITIKIDTLAFGGSGVGRLDDGMVAFVEGTIPGDTATARVTKKKKGFINAVATGIVTPSPDRRDPRCAHFGKCGGCRLQHYAYERQLEAKSRQIRDHFERIGHIPDPPMLPIISMDDPWEYRNKMEYSFETARDGSLRLGLHKPGYFDWIVDLDYCHLQQDACNRLRNATRDFCAARSLSAHNMRKHTGLLRNLVIRNTRDALMACLCVQDSSFDEHAGDFAEMVASQFPEVKSLWLFVNNSLSGVALGGEERLLAGDDHITETVCGLKLKLSPKSFMQTNTAQCERLYGAALAAAGMSGTETVFDLYTGMAPIAMAMSPRAKRVIGIESNESAVADGHVNLAVNGINNVELIAGVVENVLADLCAESRPDVIVTDPPRPGMHPATVKAILEASPRQIVYISCNPSTLARDAGLLCDGGYSLKSVQPVDMFPHTFHVECVALFVSG